jgi:hypothetical protein
MGGKEATVGDDDDFLVADFACEVAVAMRRGELERARAAAADAVGEDALVGEGVGTRDPGKEGTVGSGESLFGRSER